MEDDGYRLGMWHIVYAPDREEPQVLDESDRPVALPDGWVLDRESRYGGTWVGFARPPDAGGPTTPVEGG